MPPNEDVTKNAAATILSATRKVLGSFVGQVSIAACLAGSWCVLIESLNPQLRKWVKSQAWWPRALSNQKALMANFGYPKDDITERQAVESFTWVITMCMAHLTSATLMLPVIVRGWLGAGSSGQLMFTLGTLAEVGFDMYDGPKLFCLSFLKDRFEWLGASVPKLSFVLVGGLHHSTVISMVIPMNLKYSHLPQYHWMAFSLLGSAGICYISGHYKFTVDAKTPEGLAICKRIVLLQVIMNFASRLCIYFPAAIYLLKQFRANGDHAYLYGGAVGSLGMGFYNIAVLGDAAATGTKWLGKTLEDKQY